MLELRNVHKTLNGRAVLRGIDLCVPSRQTYVIVGGSGTGKSVTLQHMVGLMRPDRGDVLVEGQSIVHAHGRELEALRNRFGVLFQSGALLNWMTVFDNVALPLYEKTRFGDQEIRRIVEEKLEMVGLQDAGSKMPSEISGGMRKRAGLARAIVRDPQIVLYDEPTSGLDPVMSRSIDGLIRDLRERLHVTSVVVTHDLTSAFAVGDQIVLLHEGQIVLMAPPGQFRDSDHPLVRQFVQAQFDTGEREI